MTRPNIPVNSLLLTQFSEFRVKPRRPNSDHLKLIVRGNELNTVWFQDRPLRGYGHFSFDDITGKSTWNKLFNGDKPNSALSGQGRSLVFETGYFKAKENGTYISKIRLIGDQADQDIITGKWKESALLIDPTGDETGNTVVEGLAGLLVVGGGLILYKKYRDGRLAEAAEEAVRDAENANVIAEDELGKARRLVEELEIKDTAQQEALGLIKNQIQEAARINGSLLKQNSILENKIDTEVDAIRKEYGDASWGEFLRDPNKHPLPNGGGDEYLRLISQEKELAERFAKNKNLGDQAKETAEELEDAIDETIEKLNEAKATLSERLEQFNIEQQRLRAAEAVNKYVENELQGDLDDLVARQNPFDSPAFDAGRAFEPGEIDEARLFNKMLMEDHFKYKEDSVEALRDSIGDGLTRRAEKNAADIIADAADRSLDAYMKAGCTPQLLETGANRFGKAAGAICTNIESIDSIVDLYAEEFTIEADMIFKGSHVFTGLRNDLGDIGFEAELGELTEFVAGREFAGEAGELIGAFSEGTLAAEEAVGALDIASIGLGGEAFVDGLALEVGGDALLGEIALDLIEIAAIF